MVNVATGKERETAYTNRTDLRGYFNLMIDIIKGLELYEKDERLVKALPKVLEYWKKTYYGLDIKTEIEKAHSWEICNPTRRKKNRVRFLNHWLCRAYSQNEHHYRKMKLEAEVLVHVKEKEAKQRQEDEKITPEERIENIKKFNKVLERLNNRVVPIFKPEKLEKLEKGG